MRYPSRAVLINPGPPTGSLTTTPATNVTIDGVEAVSGEEDNVRGFWNTSTRGERNYSTRGVVFSPAYNEIDVPPVEVSGQGAYRRTANGPLALTGGTFLSGNRITLVTVDGDLGSSGLSTPVTATPASVSTRSVTVTGSESEFVVTLPVPGNGTAAAATAWNRSRAAESIRSNPHVLGTAVNGSRVDVTLDGTRRYELRLARVVVHDSGDSGVDADTDPQYVVAVEGNGSAVPVTGTRRVAVEVRDRYNNPVEGVAVSFSTAGGNFTSTRAGTATVVTGGEGVAAATVDPNQSSIRIDASFDGGVTPYNATTIELSEPSSGGIDEVNSRTGGVVLGASGVQSSNDKDVVLVGLNNTGSVSREITALRVAFYNPDGGSDNPPTQVTVEGRETVDVGGRFVTFDPAITIQNDTVTDVRFRFDDPAPDARGDFFILSVEYAEMGRVTYFVNVEK
ncbi:Ig-like domain-containing protein [Salinigranum sp. GCM10025319]|uniref:Ig-like domain-containing protein n=1 Tax=Salinigranum sp. GCM10025319 TaxID=3252687 RepID=UPI003612B1E4